MNEEEIFEKLKEIISEQFGIDKNTIKKDSTFTDDLAADSLDIVEFIMGIEEDFGVEIPDNVAEDFTTVENVIKYIIDNQ